MSTNVIWSPGSPNINTGQIKIAPTPTGTTSDNLQTDWKPLNVNSTNFAVQNLEYRVNDLNVVEFRYPTGSDPNGCKSGNGGQCTTKTSIQEIADDRLYVAARGYLPQTTTLIQEALKSKLLAQAEAINWRPPTEDPNETEPGTRDIDIGRGVNIPSPISDFLKNFTTEIYPENLDRKTQDVVKFELFEYGIREFSIAPNTLDVPLTNRRIGTRLGAVYLPIQPQITDQNGVNWGEEQANAFSLFAAAASARNDQIPDFITRGVETITTDKRYQDLLLTQLAGMAGGINPLARTNGLVVNPNLELLFNGPTLRPFTFVFRLSARSEPEATKIKKIIRFFKEGSAAKTTATNLFLKAPNIFSITYERNEDTHPGINRIKNCALRSVSVNYTPDGSYSVFRDGTMTSYEISLQFTELEPVYDKDYINSNRDGHILF